jgi:endonuclease IV
MLILGVHVQKKNAFSSISTGSKAMHLAIDRDMKQFPMMKSIQIMVMGPRNRNPSKMDYTKVANTIKKHNLRAFAHDTYVTSIWHGNNGNIASVIEQLDICDALGIEGFVIHMPRDTIDGMMKFLPDVVVDHNCVVMLEINACKQSVDKSFESPQKLNKLCSRLISEGMENVRIVIDTAHIWSCNYDLSSFEKASKWISNFKYPEMVGLLHFNDEAHAIGYGHDEHRNFMEGEMWKSYKTSGDINSPAQIKSAKKSGIAAFTQFAVENDIPIIIERSKFDPTNDIKLITALSHQYAIG